MGIQEEKKDFEKKLFEAGYLLIKDTGERNIYGRTFENYYVHFDITDVPLSDGSRVAAYVWYIAPSNERELVRSRAFASFDGKNIENAEREFAEIIRDDFIPSKTKHLAMSEELEAKLKK
jgi:hypothetical protein